MTSKSKAIGKLLNRETESGALNTEREYRRSDSHTSCRAGTDMSPAAVPRKEGGTGEDFTSKYTVLFRTHQSAMHPRCTRNIKIELLE